MSSWANYGLSALSNVTQSVQGLSSYAQVVLHEAREEVSRVQASPPLYALLSSTAPNIIQSQPGTLARVMYAPLPPSSPASL